MMNESLAATLGPMRAPFLLLVPVCVALGSAIAVYEGHDLETLRLVLVFMGALFAHISVNALNEYEDFKSGLDFKTQRTPFSGGTGTLPAIPHKAHYALITGVICLLLVFAIGVYFIQVAGWGIVIPGLLGMALIVFYTSYITRSPWLCLFAPGLGFGPVMILGIYYALCGEFSLTAVVASLVPLFLISNLLLMNQFPDWKVDKNFGRNHLLIARGESVGLKIFGIFLVAAYLTICLSIAQGLLPIGSALALVTVILALSVFRGLNRHYQAIPKLIPYMGQNVALSLLTPLLLAVGIYIS